MKAYSLDLRQKVVAAIERGDSTIDEVGALFGVGPTFVKKMLRQHRETGDLHPLPHGGGHTPRLSAKHLKRLQTHVERHQDATLEELREHLEKQAQVSVSAPTLSRALAQLGLPRKKKQSGE